MLLFFYCSYCALICFCLCCWIACQVFTRRGLEKTPTLEVKLSLEDRPRSGYGVHRPGLSEKEAGLVAGLLGRVRLFATTEGLIVKVKRFCLASLLPAYTCSNIISLPLECIFGGIMNTPYVVGAVDANSGAYCDCWNNAARVVLLLPAAARSTSLFLYRTD